MAILGKVDYVIHTNRPATAQHEETHWLTVDGEGIARFDSTEPPTLDRRGRYTVAGTDGEHVASDEEWLRPLADPTKPVRIRLKMSAERIE